MLKEVKVQKARGAPLFCTRARESAWRSRRGEANQGWWLI